MDNSLLAVRNINHKYIVVGTEKDGEYKEEIDAQSVEDYLLQKFKKRLYFFN